MLPDLTHLDYAAWTFLPPSQAPQTPTEKPQTVISVGLPEKASLAVQASAPREVEVPRDALLETLDYNPR